MYLFYFIRISIGRSGQVNPNQTKLKILFGFRLLVRINPKTRMDYIFEIDHIKHKKKKKFHKTF